MLVKRRRFTWRFKAGVAMEAVKGQRTIGGLAGLSVTRDGVENGKKIVLTF